MHVPDTKDVNEEREDCLCEESENGICNECGCEVDWVARMFKDTERD